MDLTASKKTALKYLEQYSLGEKSFLMYSSVLLIILLFVPIYQYGSLNSGDITLFTFFNQRSIKSNILVGIVLISMILRNISSTFKKFLYRSFGFRSNDIFVNVIFISMILISFFSLGDSITTLRANFSGIINVTQGYSFLLLYLVIGLLLSVFIAWRFQQQQNIAKPSSSNTYEFEEENTAEDEAFKRIEQEFQGLFDVPGNGTISDGASLSNSSTTLADAESKERKLNPPIEEVSEEEKKRRKNLDFGQRLLG